MGMIPKDDDALWDSLDFSELPVFETAGDLARYSIETHLGHSELVRSLQSKGFMRLHGFGVTGHQANATKAFTAGVAFQKVITAIGSSIRGAKATISKIAERQTELYLSGSPAPGSIVFNLVSAANPADELRPNGELFDSSRELLVDKSFAMLNRIFSPRSSLSDEQELITLLEDLGPQVSKSLRNFVSLIGDHHFDLELKWEQPLVPALHWDIPTLESQDMASFISMHRLDEVPVVLYGRLHTASLGNNWQLISDEYGKIGINIGDLTNKIRHSDFSPGTRVEANAMMTQSDGAGSKPKRDFRVTKLSVLED
ncbi:hypothetical protein [Glutamicibacter nicotianae]|uniref:hypothetical protein n=1 Tax=Glutamicibacter nicotianae TaxID=37929 RepID=UPI00167F427D|nr:hypothetical protein [Glutamicibacter nicotianae]